MEKNPHHLVMGELTDFLSGEIVADTHDERYRQKLARLLVEGLGYDKADIEQNREVVIRTGAQAARLKVDFIVFESGKAVMMVKYAPGSLVTRRLSNLALSRIIFPYQIPVVVTTNGEDAEIVSGDSGRLLGEGLSAIPGIGSDLLGGGAFHSINAELFDKASKIAFACWVDGACPCDGDICTIEE